MKNIFKALLMILLIHSFSYADEYYIGKGEYSESIYISGKKAWYFVNECSFMLPIELALNDKSPNLFNILSPKTLPEPDEKIHQLEITIISSDSIKISNVGCNPHNRIFTKINPRYLTSKFNNLRLRSSPNTKSKIVSLLQKGDKLIYLGSLVGEFVNENEGEWCFLITKEGTTGFSYRSFLE